jgi:hypothetical protein
MIERWPKIRFYDGDSLLQMREGVAISFFLPDSHRDIAPAVLRSLEIYCRFIQPRYLQWYPDDNGEWQELDDKGWAFNRGRMLDPTMPHVCRLELVESCSGVGDYCFEYHGRQKDSPFFQGKELSACGILVHLPTEYLEQHGPAHVRTLALELAAALPFSFGYASLAFLAHSLRSLETWKEIQKLCMRYPGLDIPSLGGTTRIIGPRARGAYWLTFLGQPLLGQLGGLDVLRQRLPSPDLSFQPLPGERLLLTLGEWPEAGDTAQGYVPPLYRQLARVLEPHLIDEIDFFRSREASRRWWRRFLDEPLTPSG